MTDGWSVSCKIALIRMPLDLTDVKSTLVQVMAWYRQATSHYLSQCWPRSLLPYGVTRPQWVKRGPCDNSRSILFNQAIWILTKNYVDSMASYCCYVSFGSGNGLVPSGTKPLPEPMLTQISFAIQGHNEFKTFKSCIFQTLNWYLEHFLWKWSQVNSTIHLWW